jgi:hypothetical protein
MEGLKPHERPALRYHSYPDHKGPLPHVGNETDRASSYYSGAVSSGSERENEMTTPRGFMQVLVAALYGILWWTTAQAAQSGYPAPLLDEQGPLDPSSQTLSRTGVATLSPPSGDFETERGHAFTLAPASQPATGSAPSLPSPDSTPLGELSQGTPSISNSGDSLPIPASANPSHLTPGLAGTQADVGESRPALDTRALSNQTDLIARQNLLPSDAPSSLSRSSLLFSLGTAVMAGAVIWGYLRRRHRRRQWRMQNGRW